MRLVAADPVPGPGLLRVDVTVIRFSKVALSFTGTSKWTITGMAMPTVETSAMIWGKICCFLDRSCVVKVECWVDSVPSGFLPVIDSE